MKHLIFSISLLVCLLPLSGSSQTVDCFYGVLWLQSYSSTSTLDVGSIFQWEPATNTYTIKQTFTNITGGNPNGPPTLFNGIYYGTTFGGGTIPACGCGTLYQWEPVSNTLTKKMDILRRDGESFVGRQVLYNDKLYGMTFRGGTNLLGVIYEWDPVTNIYTIKHHFDQPGGTRPYSSLLMYGEKFYGATTLGGYYDAGVIFEYDPVSNIYIKKTDLSPANGYKAIGGLSEYGGKLYGMTALGGSSGGGVIYEWDPNTNVYTKKIELALDANGYEPHGDLTLLNGKFYGMTSKGGTLGGGVIFEWDPNTNIYTKKVDFDPATGEIPLASLTYANDRFYGMTSRNTNSSINGSIFEWDPLSNVYTSDYIFPTVPGVTPYGGSARESNNLIPGACMNTLPLKLLGFTVTTSQNKAYLRWQTANEINTDRFEVERSLDGRWFEAVGRVAAKTALANSYTFTDADLPAGTSRFYYRLKQVDKDGTFTYSKTVQAFFKNTNDAVTLLGNPVSGMLVLSINSATDDRLAYSISDMTGRVLTQKADGPLLKGQNQLTIPVATLAAGAYMVTLHSSYFHQTIKFSKQ